MMLECRPARALRTCMHCKPLSCKLSVHVLSTCRILCSVFRNLIGRKAGLSKARVVEGREGGRRKLITGVAHPISCFSTFQTDLLWRSLTLIPYAAKIKNALKCKDVSHHLPNHVVCHLPTHFHTPLSFHMVLPLVSNTLPLS